MYTSVSGCLQISAVGPDLLRCLIWSKFARYEASGPCLLARHSQSSASGGQSKMPPRDCRPSPRDHRPSPRAADSPSVRFIWIPRGVAAFQANELLSTSISRSRPRSPVHAAVATEGARSFRHVAVAIDLCPLGVISSRDGSEARRPRFLVIA